MKFTPPHRSFGQTIVLAVVMSSIVVLASSPHETSMAILDAAIIFALVITFSLGVARFSGEKAPKTRAISSKFVTLWIGVTGVLAAVAFLIVLVERNARTAVLVAGPVILIIVVFWLLSRIFDRAWE
jgi:cobalamin synthase